jgi:hypothetical protein
VAVEQSRSASKLGWPIPSNGAAVTAWCGSSSAALRLGYPWRRGSSLARECMRVNVHGHTSANRCTRCRAMTKRWRTTRRGRHLANGGARSGTACPAVVWPRGKISAVMVENRGNATARRRCPTPARYHACERVDVCV